MEVLACIELRGNRRSFLFLWSLNCQEHKARGLKLNPKPLLLDEPTKVIQPSIADQIEDVIIGFKNSGRFAILLVERGLHVAARLAEKYVVMAKGAVVAGKSDELSVNMVKKL